MSTENVMDFWFEFDNTYNTIFELVTDEMDDAVSVLRPLRGIWRMHREAGTYPDGYADRVRPLRPALRTVFASQIEIVDRFFDGDPAAEQAAFEEFAQGVHFDPRRPPNLVVHMMDHGPDGSTIGFHAWHAAIRAAVLVDAADAERWLGIDRLVGLAWAIQTVAMPSNGPDNPRLPEALLERLREIWLPMDVEQLDAAFDSPKFPPPALLAGEVVPVG